MISAIICAAGRGERAGFAQNKLLQELNGMPALCHTLSAFSSEADEMIVVCNQRDCEAISALLSPYPNAKACLGGSTRSESVYKALKIVTGEIVLVHDGARPFVSQKIIRDCIESVKKYGSGVCALPLSDTVVVADGGNILSTPDRNTLFTVQTPQGFMTERLKKAYEQAMTDGNSYTDDSGIFAKYICPPRLFIGERSNKKLTFAEDFAPCERVGFGVDTHAFGKEQDFIVLGGAKIPSVSGLIAHSDGDVLIHALMDALLSAAALRDIGYYFPDTDERYQNANSTLLLNKVMELITEQQLAPQNVSISILAERPRLSPYIEEIKENLSLALGLEKNAIGVAAGTNEKLGYVGEGKGITVYCTILLRKI